MLVSVFFLFYFIYSQKEIYLTVVYLLGIRLFSFRQNGRIWHGPSVDLPPHDLPGEHLVWLLHDPDSFYLTCPPIQPRWLDVSASAVYGDWSHSNLLKQRPHAWKHCRLYCFHRFRHNRTYSRFPEHIPRRPQHFLLQPYFHRIHRFPHSPAIDNHPRLQVAQILQVWILPILESAAPETRRGWYCSINGYWTTGTLEY